MTAENWKSLFREFLGGRSSQYCDEIWPLLVAVDQGIKPSLLWDISAPNTKTLTSLLQAAKEKGLLTTHLKVVLIDLDILIINISLTIQVLSNILRSDKSWLIDISASEPKVANKEVHKSFCMQLISILSQLGVNDESLSEIGRTNDSSPEGATAPFSSTSSDALIAAFVSAHQHCQPKEKIVLHFPSGINLSTIFGCLLGYPQIYWWQGESGGNSLSGIPLKVFKFSAQLNPENVNVELFSYSIPEALEEALRPGIELWGAKVNSCVEKSPLFSETKFYCDPVLCLSVAL